MTPPRPEACGIRTGRGRPVLVGEQNPYSDRPEFSLYPVPEGSAGHRLCCAILGMGQLDYLQVFDRWNLLWSGERWSAPLARRRASWLALEYGEDNALILLGRRVAEAFGFPFAATPSWTRGGRARRPVVFLPHPSGRSRAWNREGAVELARAMITEAILTSSETA